MGGGFYFLIVNEAVWAEGGRLMIFACSWKGWDGEGGVIYLNFFTFSTLDLNGY